ncbi:MAG: GntR family transcriptional regulator [Pseudoclavibacter sp.]
MASKSDRDSQGVDLVDRIAHDIRDGFYHPRERLVEMELCERFGASRNAVRAALIELTALGLVEREANRGARVRRVSLDEAIESAEVRLTLQAMCTRLAAANATDDDRQALQGLVDELRAAVDEGDRPRSSGANSAISKRIREISGHATATRIIESLQAQVPLNRYPYQIPDRRLDSMREFESVVASVISGDEDAALDSAIVHRDNVVNALRAARDAMMAEPV